MAVGQLGRRMPAGARSVRVVLQTWYDGARAELNSRALQNRWAHLLRRAGVTRSGYIAIAVAVLLWLFARIVAGTAIYATAYGALALVGVAVVLAPRRLGLRGDRTGLRPRVREGDTLEVHFALTAKRGVTAFVVEERVPNKLGETVRVPVTRLRANGVVEHSYELRCSRRGAYSVGPLVAVAADPLGLYRRETVVAKPFELLVHPRVEAVSDRPLTRQFEDPPIRPPVSKPWPSGLEFYGMREYVPGDDLRRVVWRATARTGRVMVREAEQGITDHITIILDTDRGGHSRDTEDLSESFETAVRAAASLGVRHLRDGYEVRCETNGGQLTRPLRGAVTQMMLLDALARLDMSREPIGKVFMRLIANPRRDAHNIVITPRLRAHDAALLRALINTGVSVLVVALQWRDDDDEDDTVAAAASVGASVTAVHPGDDLGMVLRHSIGAGTR